MPQEFQFDSVLSSYPCVVSIIEARIGSLNASSLWRLNHPVSNRAG